jgi:hypothetical protein
MEWFHQTLKAAIICHADQCWTEVLPLVLLGIHTAFKEDLQASVDVLIYSELLRIPGELLTLIAKTVNPAHLITELHQDMAHLQQHATPHTATSRSACTSSSVRTQCPRLWTPPPPSRSCHIERRHCNSLCTAGSSPCQPTVKPTYVLNETECRTTTTFNSAVDATPAVAPPPIAQSTRSRRHLHFPARFNI